MADWLADHPARDQNPLHLRLHGMLAGRRRPGCNGIHPKALRSVGVAKQGARGARPGRRPGAGAFAGGRAAMRIKAKILWALLGMSLLVVLVGGYAIYRQRAVGTLEATSEAEEGARRTGFHRRQRSGPGSRHFSKSLALYLRDRRDVEVVDTHKRIIADAKPEEVGRMSDNGGDAIDLTLRDGQVRTFSETGPKSRRRPAADRGAGDPVRPGGGSGDGGIHAHLQGVHGDHGSHDPARWSLPPWPASPSPSSFPFTLECPSRGR